MPNLLRRYRDIQPGITTQLEEAGSGELMEALLEQRLDAAFVRSPASGIPGLSVEPVLSEPMIVALPLGHRLAQKRSSRCRWPNWPTSRLFSIAARPAGCTTPSGRLPPRRLQPAHRAGSAAPAGHPQLVGAGLGLSVVPGSMRRLGGDGIVYRTLAEEAAQRPALRRCAAARLRRSSNAFVSWCWRPWGRHKTNKNGVRLLFI